MFNTEQLQEKWAPVLSHSDLPEIKDSYKKAVTSQLLENQEKFLREERMLTESPTNAGPINTPTTGAGAVAGFDPVLISLIRRSMPNLIAYDMAVRVVDIFKSIYIKHNNAKRSLLSTRATKLHYQFFIKKASVFYSSQCVFSI